MWEPPEPEPEYGGEDAASRLRNRYVHGFFPDEAPEWPTKLAVSGAECLSVVETPSAKDGEALAEAAMAAAVDALAETGSVSTASTECVSSASASVETGIGWGEVGMEAAETTSSTEASDGLAEETSAGEVAASAEIPMLQDAAPLVETPARLADTLAGTLGGANTVPSARPKAKPPGKAPPPRASASGAQLPPAGAGRLPSWRGPQPPPGWKAQRVVNWQPMRQAGRWEGSVWQLVHSRMEEGFTPLPDGLLNQAFMRRIDEASSPRKSASRPRARSARRFSQKAALTADLLHAQLARMGVQQPGELAWVTGQRSGATRRTELSEDVLEAFAGFLSVAASEEERLRTVEDDAQLPPAEEFLRRLLQDAGSLKVLHGRVELALQIARFPGEAAHIEHGLQLGLRTSRAILESSSLPALLEGVLLLGNYVNANCKGLAGAVGVTLDSLAKLAHTRCLPAGSRPSARGQSDGADVPRGDNALLLLVQHLQQTRPGFATALSRDLDGCKAARDLDAAALEENLGRLTEQVRVLEARLKTAAGEGAGAALSAAGEEEGPVPDALQPDRLRIFVSQARPTLKALQGLLAEFHAASAELRRWFAEGPDASFGELMRNFVTLREALPAPLPQALPLFPRPCRLRHVGRRTTRRPLSEPPPVHQRGGAPRRSGSAPARIHVQLSSQPGSVGRMVVHQPQPKQALSHEDVNRPEAAAIRTPPRRPTALKGLPFSAAKLRPDAAHTLPPSVREPVGEEPGADAALTTKAARSTADVVPSDKSSPPAPPRVVLPEAFGASQVLASERCSRTDPESSSKVTKVSLPAAFAMQRIESVV